MDKGEKEIVELMSSWQKEITKITVDYNIAIEKVDTIRDEYETAKKQYQKKLYIEYKNVIIGIIVLFALSGVFIALNKFTNFCGITLAWPPVISGQECKP